MTTDRRKFLALLALGVPATTTAMQQGSLSTIQSRTRESESEGSPVIPLDLIEGVRERLWDTSLRRDAIRILRRGPSDCPPGKIRWAIEIEEPDESSNTLLGMHPRVLLVYGKSLQVLYGICLEQAGCSVQSVLDINEAVRLYRKHGPYDIVLTDLPQYRELSKRIREENPGQAIAIVGSCSGTHCRFAFKVPIVRQGPRQDQLVRLVESAIKPRVRILLVIAEPNADLHWERGRGPRLKGAEIERYQQVWHLVTSHPETFEIELESDGIEALKRYRERGPYDMVLSEFRLPGLSGTELAAAIRSENSSQRIVMITHARSVGSQVLRELGDIPVLNLAKPRTTEAQKRARTMGRYEDGEGQGLIDWVEAGLKVTYKKTAKKEA